MPRPFPSLRFRLLAPCLSLLLAGCATTEAVRRIPIAGGKYIEASLGPKGPKPSQADGFEALVAELVPGPAAGTLTHHFVFSAPAGAELRHVRIEDVSPDERIRVLLEDAQPGLANQRWSGRTEPLVAADPRLAWLYHVVPSLRVYRFTLTSASGRVTELYQAVAYPPFIKETIRRQRGEKTP